MDYEDHCLTYNERIMTQQRSKHRTLCRHNESVVFGADDEPRRLLLPNKCICDVTQKNNGKCKFPLKSESQANEQLRNKMEVCWGRKRPLFTPYPTSWWMFVLLLFLSPHCINLSKSEEIRTRRDIRFEWKAGPWEACESLTCGAGGIQDRTVNCIYAKRGWRTTHSNCESDEKPDDRRSCFKVCDEHRDEYRWSLGEWQECQLHDSAPATEETGDKCGLGFVQLGRQRRNITCVSVIDPEMVMEDYVCAKFSSSPFQTRSCKVPCPINCVTSHWGEWSRCSKSCGNGTQYRTRSVFTNPEYGGSDCPTLSSMRVCPDLPVCDIDPVLEIFEDVTLKFGNWSECQTARIELPGASGRRKAKKEHRRRLSVVQKTLVGRRERSVTCLNVQGESIGDSVSVYETCTVPKDCDTTGWSAWTMCYAPCGAIGNQTRTREIKTLPSGPGARGCPLLEETRECLVNENRVGKCTRYTWVTGGWTDCETIGDAICGGGTQKRDVYCVMKDFTIYQALAAAKLGGKLGLKEWAKMQPVNDDHCDGKYQPTIWQTCEVHCQPRCVLGPWSDWSDCAPEQCRGDSAAVFIPDSLVGRRKSAKSGFKRRTREVLASSDNKDGCEHTMEVIPCDKPRCYSWHPVTVGSCSPNSGSCGEGTQEQTVVCRNMWGRDVEDSNCKRKPEPPSINSTFSCYVPCGSDCVIGDWSSWTPCTHVCRGRRDSGNQTRFREILANPGPGGLACPSLGQLQDSRACNQHRCSVYFWDVSEWNECQVKDSVTPTISSHALRMSDMFMSDDGNYSKPLLFPSDDNVPVCGTGYQDRVVKCRKKDSGAVQNKLCGGPQTMPLRSRDCTFPCPRDCVVSEWSDWSDCEKECDKVARPGMGSPGPIYQRRHRAVIQHRTGRGTPCPFEMKQERPCIEPEKCMSYKWRAWDWSECVLTHGASTIYSDDTGASDPLCLGAMTRRIHCLQVASNGVSLSVDYRFCLKYGSPDNPIPEGARHCIARCKPDSNFMSWQEKIGCMTSVTNIGETAEDLYGIENSARNRQSYLSAQKTARPVGDWSSCNISKPNDPNIASLLGQKMSKPYCGKGTRRRALACYVEGTSIIVDNSYCHYRDFQEESCEIPCPIDCSMSEWSSWGKCGDSTVGQRDAATAENRTMNGSEVEPPCGQNVQMRYRFINSREQHGGKACPVVDSLGLEYEVAPCYTVCNSMFWVPYSWKPCEVQDNGAFSNCGSGVQSRDVKCFQTDRLSGHPNVASMVADPRECDLETMPFGSRGCSSPCPGHCVYSEWSSWQKCESHMGRDVMNTCDGVRKRVRVVLREANTSAVVQDDALLPDVLCGSNKVDEDSEPCDLNRNCFTFSAMWTEWSSCSLPPDATCGTGSRERRSNCVSSSGLPVHENECIENDVPLPRPEREACQVGCAVDCQVAEWTSWSHCGDACDGVVVRNRTRKVMREASPSGRPCPVTLETTPCPPSQCHMWNLGEWSECKIGGRNCGTGLKIREIKCVQHDGVVVSETLCRNEQGDVDHWFGDSKLRQDCQVACSGECHMTQWSAWGDCHLRCLDAETPVAGATSGVQTRSRVGFIAGQLSEGDCPSKEIEERRCPLEDAKCYIYDWATGVFHKGKRPVWCQRSVDKLNVSFGCQEQLRPQVELYCNQNCDSIPFSYCTQDGVCDCDVGYRAVGQLNALEACVEAPPNDEAKIVHVVETMDRPEVDQRSVVKVKGMSDPEVTTLEVTELPVVTTGAVIKESSFFGDLGLLDEEGKLKVWVYAVIAGIVVSIIFIVVSIYLICVYCCRKKTATTMYGSYPTRGSSSIRKNKRRYPSSGSNVGVGMVIGMGTSRYPPSNSAMSHTSSTSRSGFSYPEQYGSEVLWHET